MVLLDVRWDLVPIKFVCGTLRSPAAQRLLVPR